MSNPAKSVRSSLDHGNRTPTREHFTFTEPPIETMPDPHKVPELHSTNDESPIPPPEEPIPSTNVIPATPGNPDDSDTDFQSAYSASPRDSYAGLDDDDHSGTDSSVARNRTLSSVTAVLEKEYRPLVAPSV